MASTFFGLNIAYTGLTAANAALNTTANNISNTNTDGYSRQLVNQKAASSIRTYTTYGCSGAGVETMSIERERDAFYDFKFWNNNANKGEFEELEYYYAGSDVCIPILGSGITSFAFISHYNNCVIIFWVYIQSR